ncbi:Golgi mannosyltransferase complex subunit [Rhizopus stolonifer]|uniref:Golgi mannosyltransferase complex subunit n=1 Tax=Rhizopus stolonifer TaxID=4846 RepID=A0A367IXH9_RHIST|nr:Golgi mannosyltransferase complex subunit [Rhizopus stolonifer]
MLQTTKVQVLSLLVTVGFLTCWLFRNKSLSTFINPHGQHNQQARILILTPFKQSAHLIDQYFENIEKLAYPRHLISLGFIVSDSPDGTLEKLQDRAASSKKESLNRITIIQKDFDFKMSSDENRHQFDVQVQRRAIMAKSRNTLLSSALEKEDDYVLWLDGDVVEYPKSLLTDLIRLDKDVIAPNCWWHSYNEEGGYDKNNWQETKASLELQKTLAPDQVLVEGYDDVLKTHRKLMVNMRHEENQDDFHLVPLDAVGGTCTFVKAQVHREGAIFPPFPFQHQVETEGFAKMAKALGYSVWGLPNYLVYHYI